MIQAPGRGETIFIVLATLVNCVFQIQHPALICVYYFFLDWLHLIRLPYLLLMFIVGD